MVLAVYFTEIDAKFHADLPQMILAPAPAFFFKNFQNSPRLSSSFFAVKRQAWHLPFGVQFFRGVRGGGSPPGNKHTNTQTNKQTNKESTRDHVTRHPKTCYQAPWNKQPNKQTNRQTDKLIFCVFFCVKGQAWHLFSAFFPR